MGTFLLLDDIKKESILKLYSPKKIIWRPRMRKARFVNIMLMVVIVCLLLSSCKENPKTQAVIEKGDNKLEETIKQSKNQSISPTVKCEIPQKWNGSNKSQNESFIININANVIVPDVSKYPVLIIGPQDITQEQADQFIKCFFKNAEIYEHRPMDLVTQEDIIKEIQGLYQFYATMKEKDPQEYEKASVGLNQTIENLRERMKGLPVSYKPTPTDTSFISQNVDESNDSNLFSDLKVIDITAYFGDELPASIYIAKNHSNKMNSYSYTNIKTKAGIPCSYNIEDMSHSIGLTITYDQAKNIAEELLKDLKIEGMNLNAAAFTPAMGDINIYSTQSAAETNPYYYTFYFTKQFDGISWTYTNPYFNESDITKQYAEMWKDEYIKVMVDDTGIVLLQWVSPANIIETFDDNVTLLSFNDMIQKFIQQLQTSGAYALNDKIVKREFTINEIRLGYAKVARQNNPDQYLLVPAWDFFGTCKNYMAKDILDPSYDQDNAIVENNFRQSFMTINAIDGSIINRNLGY